MHSRPTFGRLVFAAGLLLAAPADAQQASRPTQQEEGRPVLRATRTPQSIAVDGRLDEPIWMDAQPAIDFTQREPSEGAPASQRTEVRIVYDDAALYVGARLFDTGAVATRLGRRDSSLPG